MITKLDLDNWAESLGEVIAQRIVENCYKESDYDELVKKEYDGLTDQEKYILWNYAAVYSQDEEMDLEDFTIQSMIDSCGDMRYDEEME